MATPSDTTLGTPADNPATLIPPSEAALRDVVRVIAECRDDETPVFTAILSHASELCQAALAVMVLGRAGDDHLTYVASHGDKDAIKALQGSGKVPVDPEKSLTARAILAGRSLHVEDMADTEEYRNGHPQIQLMIDKQGARSVLFVPLMGQEGGVGAIVLFRQELRPFSDAQIALAETFAEQAVIAIQMVRQYRELKTRFEHDEALREILRVINGSRADTTPVFEVILRNAARLCGAPLASLAMCNEERTHLVLKAHWGDALTHLAVDQTAWPMDSQLTTAVAVRDHKTVHVADMKDTDLYRQGEPSRTGAVDKEGVLTSLAVPLIADGQALGSIALYRREQQPFDDDQIALVENFAEQAVIAIENVVQFKALEARTAEVVALNSHLEERVEEQVSQLERLGRLKRFLSPQVADAVVSSGNDSMLDSHRAMIAVLFCDIRGFTAFCESAEPEETIEVLQTFHETLGKLIYEAGAGFDHRAGDGLMVVFNDPVPCEDPAMAALNVAIAMREKMSELCRKWRKLGHRMGFGVGISLGYATVGMVGFEGRYDYTANGTVVNLAARLCDHAGDQEILLSQRAATALEGEANVVDAGELSFKGFNAPVNVYKVAEPGEGE